jgi:hypothetical protein
MKESLTKIENKLKKLLSFKRMNPHIYWRNLLYVFVIITIILISFSLYILSEIKNQQIFQIAPKSEKLPSLMNEKLFDKVTESFDNKLMKEKEIEGGLIKYKDPSLKN